MTPNCQLKYLIYLGIELFHGLIAYGGRSELVEWI